MPVDTSIYGGIKYQRRDPLEEDIKEMQYQSARRKYTMDMDTEEAARTSGGDPNRMADFLAQKGHYQQSLAVRGQAQQQELRRQAEARAQSEEARKAQDQQLQVMEAVGADAISMDSAFRQALQATGGNREAAVAQVMPIWQNVRRKWAQQGTNLSEQFDPDANFAWIGKAKSQVEYLKSLRGKDAEPTPLARYRAERDELRKKDPNHPDLPKYEALIADYKAGRPETIINNNLPGPMQPGKPAVNKIDEGILDTTANLMQLDAIQSQFKPEYQTFMTKGANWWSSLKEKAGVDLKVKEKKDLEEFSAYKRNSIDSLNKYIKSVTGAAMTNAEAERILRGLPNPGTGLFDGDSPTEFKAKMDDVIKQTKVAVARLAYMKRNGLSLEDGAGNASVPLERMPILINQRGKELEGELGNKGVKGDALKRAVRRQLGIEFGLVAD